MSARNARISAALLIMLGIVSACTNTIYVSDSTASSLPKGQATPTPTTGPSSSPDPSPSPTDGQEEEITGAKPTTSSKSFNLYQVSNGAIDSETPMQAVVPPVAIRELTDSGVSVPGEVLAASPSIAILHLRIDNSMKVPLSFYFRLSKDSGPSGTIDATPTPPPAGDVITLQSSQSRQVDFPVDSTLLKRNFGNPSLTLYLHMSVGTSGSNGQLVTVSGHDSAKVEFNIDAKPIGF